MNKFKDFSPEEANLINRALNFFYSKTEMSPEESKILVDLINRAAFRSWSLEEEENDM
jgi:hypothetical protein